jgi:hypothetical protein
VNAGRAFVLFILVSAALAGGSLWYLQVYGYYTELTPEDAARQTVTLADGTQAPLAVTQAQAIDATSSPIRYRACLTVSQPDRDRLSPYPDPVPLNAPGWFDCFDAAAIGAALKDGTAQAYLAQADTPWGIDRVIAFTDDGRAFVWPQINRCGKAVFDGKPAPEGCPPPPEKE